MPTKKEKCKEFMQDFFGPASAKVIDSMRDDEAVAKCRQKVAVIYGEEKAKVFDSI